MINRYEILSIRVIDGDTIEATVDLGFDIHFKSKFRLNGINAPEMRGANKEAGQKARQALKTIATTPDTQIQTIKDRKGKYGRYLAILWNGDVNINRWMVINGHAEFKVY